MQGFGTGTSHEPALLPLTSVGNTPRQGVRRPRRHPTPPHATPSVHLVRLSPPPFYLHRQVVIHFYRPSTLRCQIVDRHLETLAAGHLETRFLKINAEKCPFLVEKLRIIMLPTILCVKVRFAVALSRMLCDAAAVARRPLPR